MLERLREGVRKILPVRRVAEVIAFETAVLYYSRGSREPCRNGGSLDLSPSTFFYGG